MRPVSTYEKGQSSEVRPWKSSLWSGPAVLQRRTNGRLFVGVPGRVNRENRSLCARRTCPQGVPVSSAVGILVSGAGGLASRGLTGPGPWRAVRSCSAAGASVLGLGAGLAGLTGGYVVQKCRLHCGHSQNCCGGHGSSGPGSFRSIWLPHRWQRTLTSGWSMARQIVVFRPSDSQ